MTCRASDEKWPGGRGLVRKLLTVVRVVWELTARQFGTEPFRTYVLARIATLFLAGLAGAAALHALRPALDPVADSRLLAPVLGGAVALLSTLLLGLRLLVHRWLAVGSLRGVVDRGLLSASGEALFARSLPRTFLAVFLFLIAVPWVFAARGVGVWFEELSWGGLAGLTAATCLLGWWSLGEDSEAAAGALLWPWEDRPVRFFERRFRTAGLGKWEETARLLELSESEVGALFAPGAATGDSFRRRLVGHVLSELTARLANVVAPGRLPEVVRARLPGLGGGSVLALARRAADPRDPLTVADFYVRVGGLRAGELPSEATFRGPLR